MKIKNTAIFLILYLVLSAFSKNDENTMKNCHFLFNKESCLSQNGVFFRNKGAFRFNLVNLFGNEEDSLILIDNFYEIQKGILPHSLVIKSISKSRSGNINVLLKENQEIRLQQHKLKEQLLHLNLLLTSKKSKKLMNNFQSIDLRYKDKVAIKHF
jgi:cell division septal protein FtsQ